MRATKLNRVLTQLEKDVSNFAKRGSTTRTANYLSGRLALLEKSIESAAEMYEKCVSELQEEEKGEDIENTYEQIRELYFEYRGDLLDNIDKVKAKDSALNATNIDSNDAKPSHNSELRLKNIPVPVFSGSYESWRSFHDLFVSLVHHNSSLSEVQKMHYLKTSVSGEAEKLLAHLGIANGNYLKAWGILQDRYDHRRFLVNTQLKCFFNLATITQERAESIKELLDTSTEVVHSLDNLKVPVQHWDVILVYVLLQKLPSKTQQLWEERLGSKKDSKELPTFAEFTHFLETRFRTLEAVNHQQVRVASSFSKPVSQRNVLYAATSTAKYSCQICSKGQHAVRKCRKFLKMGIADRSKQVNKLGLCRNCLAYSHTCEQCPSSRRCYYCQQAHHSLLHSGNAPQIGQISSFSSQGSSSGPATSSMNPGTSHNHSSERVTITRPNVNTFHTSSPVTQVLLATALVKVRSGTGQSFSLRALLDSGSEASFITTSAVQMLSLPLKSTSVKVAGLGLVSSGICSKVVDISLASHHSTFRVCTQALVLKSLSGHLPTHTLTTTGWEHITGLTLADPHFYQSAKVDLLLGSDVLADILMPDMVKPSNLNLPIAQKTRLGWILFGRAPVVSQGVNSFLQRCSIETDLRRFWELEEISYQPFENPEDIECEKHFTENVRRLSDGRFQVALPFKGGIYPLLGRSREGAITRFKALERRLERDPYLKLRYTECLEDYLHLGHMEAVEDDTAMDLHHYYVPHHAVLKEGSSTTKLRVVFDASFKTADGVSLNDQLMVGPALQQNITNIILRWRLYRYTFTGDIEKMYRQIRVPERDAQYQLILWRKEPSDILKTYRLNTVTFGTAPAPYLAIRTLQALADEVRELHPRTAAMIRNEMYVDDLMSGAETVEEAKQKMTEVKEILAGAGFHLRKWTANHGELLDCVPVQDHEVSFSLPTEGSDRVKTLGIQWLPLSDEFSFSYISSESQPPTKRSILSAIARLFDPMGWIAPAIIRAKIIMQLLWVRKQSWDEPVDPDIAEEWKLFYNDLPAINELKIPRWMHTASENNRTQLHGFCDSSERAYGAAVYLRVEDESGNTQMHLIMAKSKVAPVSPVTLPRLELCGAVMLAKLIHHITRTLEGRGIPTFAWTDSMIALCWIRSEPAKWETFVRNRVGEIQRLTKADIWNHVPSQLNPADLVSRGIAPSALLQSTLWWNGPTFLTSGWDFESPAQPTDLVTDESVKAHHAKVNVPDSRISQLVHRSSRFPRLLRTVAYCIRFGANARTQRSYRTLGPLTSSELEMSTKILTRLVQREMFSDDATRIRGMASLNPFTDGDGILRVGGRLKNADLLYNQQHPIIMTPSHHFTKLLMKEAHIRTLHGGIQLMMGYLRQKYWIFQLRRSVKKQIHECTICFRYRSKTAHQLMGNLPSPRVRISKPFTHTGVDYAGPLEIKTWRGRGAKTYKGYLAIFVCLTTKALHLEAVTDLTTQAFLAAFRRFAARRGLCHEIYSDCGTNFVGAEAELYRLLDHATHDWKEIAEVLASQGTQWKFIPPASPHFGGLWEAGVKSVKHHFKRVVGNGTLTYEELATLLTQIEACLNSRPLCPLSEDPDDFHALTPSHFLIGQEVLTVPEPDLASGKICLTDRWKAIQLRMQTFWRHWQQEYLTRLQNRPKWLKEQPPIKIGDLVLLKDERMPPSRWSLARVTETYPGSDNITRVVKLKTHTGECKRPITKLCPLPINTIYNEDATLLNANATNTLFQSAE